MAADSSAGPRRCAGSNAVEAVEDKGNHPDAVGDRQTKFLPSRVRTLPTTKKGAARFARLTKAPPPVLASVDSAPILCVDKETLR